MKKIRLKARSRNGAERVYETIRRQIKDGSLAPGDRLASFRDLQETFGVSFRVINETIRRLVDEGYLLTRRGVGVYVRRRREDAKKSIRILNSQPPGMGAILGRPIQRAACEALEEAGRSCAIEQTESFELGWARDIALNDFKNKRYAAHIWIIRELGPQSMPAVGPVVMVSQNMESVWSRSRGYDIVTCDSRQGGALAAERLEEQGCRNVVVLLARRSYNQNISSVSAERFRGFEERWLDPLPPVRAVPLEENLQVDGVHMSRAILDMDPRPDGVFCVSDEVARALCFSLQAHHVQPGRDIKVIGFDGQPKLEEENFTLTSVAAPLELLGRAAARAAIERADDPDAPMRRIQIGCELRIGDTG